MTTNAEIEFEIAQWLDTKPIDGIADELSASLGLTARDGRSTYHLFQVYDELKNSVSPNVHLSAYSVAVWILTNWWRLRWEPYRTDSDTWEHAHSLASIGNGFAWPPLTICGDGEFIQLNMAPELSADVAAVRYLRGEFTFELPAANFESAIDRFVQSVRKRLVEVGTCSDDLDELIKELDHERADPKLSLICRLQALAGMDPGDASDEWFETVQELTKLTGPKAITEIMATLPAFHGDLEAASMAIRMIRDSNITMRMPSFDIDVNPSPVAEEIPWRRGARYAQVLREHLGLSPGASISNGKLSEFLGTSLPFPSKSLIPKGPLTGGVRKSDSKGLISVGVSTPNPASQRFHAARIVGSATLDHSSQVFAVTKERTSMQKFQRAFAQEFLCPWSALDAFTDDKGVDEDAIEQAAEHFGVSDYVVRYALVNHNKLDWTRIGFAA